MFLLLLCFISVLNKFASISKLYFMHIFSEFFFGLYFKLHNIVDTLGIYINFSISVTLKQCFSKIKMTIERRWFSIVKTLEQIIIK